MQEYPIGTVGQPWQQDEKLAWLQLQTIKRSYQQEVINKLNHVEGFTKLNYGELHYVMQGKKYDYPLYGFVPKTWGHTLPTILITGGVHGYETSGVQGAIEFLLKHAQSYLSKMNIIVAPCVSPWGYETINRWNPDAMDPNRSFYPRSPCNESALLMEFVQNVLNKQSSSLLMHIDLHETTDTDNSEFRPALAARDGITDMPQWEIPDGFYTVAKLDNPKEDFQKAIIKEVSKVTHIAPSDDQGKIIGAETISEGVICYDKAELFLCGGFTNAEYVSTTEVYPDSPNATDEVCIQAQVAALRGGIDYLINNQI